MNIYLATNYSHPTPAIRQLRFERINSIASDVIKEGHIVYSPISHSHPIAISGDLPTTWSFWESLDRPFIEWCDELWWYAQVGWQVSEGLLNEKWIATELRKPVVEYKKNREI